MSFFLWVRYVLFTLRLLTRSLFWPWHPSTSAKLSECTLEVSIMELVEGLR